MSRHKLLSRRTRRIWTALNAIVLVVLSGWVFHVATRNDSTAPRLSAEELLLETNPTVAPSIAPTATIPTKAEFMAAGAKHFGVSYAEAPFNKTKLAGITRNAGAPPTMIEYFIKWTEEFRPVVATKAYDQGAIPVVAWEPWAGVDKGINQPKYALRKINDGTHDAYITRFATAVKAYQWPIVLRFAHEMNGAWFPWSERRSGNKPGEYVKAWQHVHALFQKAGVTNVIWTWSPNIVRPAPNVDLQKLYPGDAYVDWVGMVGYAVKEKKAGEVFDPTLAKLRAFTKRPALITETGAQPGPNQAEWTSDLFRWLRTRPDVLGFIWFEFDKSGETQDWRFSRSETTKAAFRAGIAANRFAPPVRP